MHPSDEPFAAPISGAPARHRVAHYDKQNHTGPLNVVDEEHHEVRFHGLSPGWGRPQRSVAGLFGANLKGNYSPEQPRLLRLPG